jgi:GNAT superfamily N-acetyltransferase
MQILPLTGNHNRQNFDCGRTELNNWLQQVARQHQDKGLSKTFVAVLPQRIPGVRLGRLAVDLRYQNKGLGELLLVDAISRARRIHQEAGVVGLFVDAIDDNASGFYRQYGFLNIPDNPLLLFYPIA